MESSPGCWATYGEVLARQYSNRDYWFAHRLAVDSYAVQHPGQPSRQAIGSVALHLMRMCAALERGLNATEAPHLMKLIAKEKRNLRWLEPPADLGGITVLDVYLTPSAVEHNSMVRSWAESLWSAWSAHHLQVRDWLDAYSVDPHCK